MNKSLPEYIYSGIIFGSTLKMSGQDLNVNSGQEYNELILYSVPLSYVHVPVYTQHSVTLS